MNEPDPGERIARLEQEVTALHARVALLEQPKVPVAAPPQVARPRSDAAANELETKLGTYWLSRIGIASLITGMALLIITYFGALGPILRVALGYAIASVLTWAGLRISRQHGPFGRVVFGGGLAIAYFVTYALHFVPAMQIIASETLGVLLVAVAIAGIVITAHRMQSETVAGIALFLGLHTGMLTDVTALTLVCTTLLAAGAAFFLAANRWVIVPISTVIAVYSTHATLVLGTAKVVSPELSVAFLCVDFLLFAIAALIRPDVRSLMALALLNWLGVVLLGSHELVAVSRDALFYFLCAVAVANGLLAVLARLRSAPPVFVMFQVALAIITAALALPVRLDGWGLLSGWIVLGLLAAYIARRAAAPVFSGVALIVLVVVQGLAYVQVHGVLAQVVCVAAFFVAEQLHAPREQRTAIRSLLVASVALGLLRLASIAFVGVHVVAWVGAAFVLFAAGFVLRSRPYRWAAFGVLGIAALQLLGVELRLLSANQKIVTFVVAGVLLLIVSFIYTRARSRQLAK